MVYKNTEKCLNAIFIVREMVKEQMQLNDYYYRGDKDTLIEAFNDVMRKQGISNWYELDADARGQYLEKNNLEISDRCDELVKLGNDDQEFLNKVNKLLDLFIETIESNRNLNENNVTILNLNRTIE